MSEQKFYQCFDPLSGEMQWKVVQDDSHLEIDEDMTIQIARSNFGDMIYDYDRNDKYSDGLKYHIEHFKKEGRSTQVVDIGTGTGLLSMMAASHGADFVTAIEVFDPMAITARKVIKNNDLMDRIQVMSSHSTALDENSVEKKADIIVAEVFDTELIGEGALRSFKEGLLTFAKPGCRVVPATGVVWVCPVASKKLQEFRRLPGSRLKAPFTDCPGTAAVFDLQLSEIDPSWFTVLSEPVKAFDFNFESSESIKYDETFVRNFIVKATGISEFDTIFMWWDIDMDGTGQNFISTVPKQFSDKAVWRDHWMQAIYYLPESIKVSEGQSVDLICSHDEYSLWFSATGAKHQSASICSCRLHCLLSRYDFYRLNAVDQNDKFLSRIANICNGKTVVTFGDGSLISVYASQTAKQVFAIEGRAGFELVQGYLTANGIKNVLLKESLTDLAAELKLLDDVVILGEPFFSTEILPWHGTLRFVQMVADARKLLPFDANVEIFPKKSMLCCMPVKFEHLWKIAAPVGIVNGFDLSPFDVLCQKARIAADPIVEQHSLFEYPSVATGPVVLTSVIDTAATLSTIPSQTTSIQYDEADTNGLAFWCDFDFGEGCSITNGLKTPCATGEQPSWQPGCRQGVYFLPLESMKQFKGAQVKVAFQETDLHFEFEQTH